MGNTVTSRQIAQGVNLKGKVAIITGANTGLGKETTRVLARQGAHVILACRNEEKALAAVKEIKEETGNQLVESLHLDLASFASIHAFHHQIITKSLPLHLLINNAGVMATDWALTADGFESQFGICHLGHFLLTGLLMEKLVASTPSRVVVLSSKAHRFGTVNVLNPYTKPESYWRYHAYANAKLANLLFGMELNRRYAHLGVITNVVHPGVIATEIVRYDWMSKMIFAMSSPMLKSVEEGASTTIYAALSQDEPILKGGQYLVNCAVAQAMPLAYDELLASKLWETSQELCKWWYPTTDKLLDIKSSTNSNHVEIIPPLSILAESSHLQDSNQEENDNEDKVHVDQGEKNDNEDEIHVDQGEKNDNEDEIHVDQGEKNDNEDEIHVDQGEKNDKDEIHVDQVENDNHVNVESENIDREENGIYVNVEDDHVDELDK